MRSTKDPVDAEGAIDLLEGVTDLYVAKGKKTLHFDLKRDRPSDGVILGLILGRSGTLRAPAIRKGRTFVVGYNPDILGETLLSAPPSHPRDPGRFSLGDKTSRTRTIPTGARPCPATP